MSGTDNKPNFGIPEHINRRIDLPPEAYSRNDNQDKRKFPRRPGFNTSGTAIRVGVNQFRVSSLATIDVFQYDVSLEPLPLHKVVYKKIWATKMLQNSLKVTKSEWLHDGSKLAW